MRRRGIVQLAATVLGLVAASVLVWRTSSAAFTDTTDNSGNSFSASTVTLTDDDAGSALFTATNMIPGTQVVGCIEVTYTGSVTPGSAVTFYASSSDTAVGGDGLTDDLDVVIERGDAGATCGAIGTPTSILSTALGSVNAVGSPLDTGWTPTLVTDVTRAFRITVTLGADTANDAQGESASATFTWAVSS